VLRLVRADERGDALQVVVGERLDGAQVGAHERGLERDAGGRDALRAREGARGVRELHALRRLRAEHLGQRVVMVLLVLLRGLHVGEHVAREEARPDRPRGDVHREQLGGGRQLRDRRVARRLAQRRPRGRAEHRASGDEGEATRGRGATAR
jgi:hypothetical protein